MPETTELALLGEAEVVAEAASQRHSVPTPTADQGPPSAADSVAKEPSPFDSDARTVLTVAEAVSGRTLPSPFDHDGEAKTLTSSDGQAEPRPTEAVSVQAAVADGGELPRPDDLEGVE